MTAKPGTRTLHTLLGHRITVFADDYIGKKIARTGLYEKETLSFLIELLQNIGDAVVLDIGANIGNHALAFSTVASRVHAFEPLPDAHVLLQQNIRQNGIENIQVHHFALSDENATCVIYQNKTGNVGGSSFDRQGGRVEPVTVDKKIGDEVVEEFSPTRIDLVKIDVEGHEAFVLQGLMGTLRTFRPYITMEWADRRTIERLSDSVVMRFLNDEYRIYVLGTRHERGYWEGKRFSWFQRKLTRLFRPRALVLYEFDPTRIYRNLLLVPKGKDHYLPKQAQYVDRIASGRGALQDAPPVDYFPSRRNESSALFSSLSIRRPCNGW